MRYFHPSDEASAADWNRFALDAVLAVEPAATPAELASTLERVFAPVAPRVKVLVAGAPRPMMEMQSGAYVTLWQHRGLGPPQGRSGTPYYSMRFLVPAEQSPLVAFAPFRADLPGGVSCMVPLAQYRPAGPLVQVRPLPPPGGSPNDRATRLAAVIVAWNVFQNFYPYLDDVGPVWMGALGRLLSEAAEDQDAVAFHATLNKMAVILRDGRFAINGPGAPPDYVPAVVWTMAEGRITALSSQAAEVKPGDALISIDGKPAADVLAAREAITAGSSAAIDLERERWRPRWRVRSPRRCRWKWNPRLNWVGIARLRWNAGCESRSCIQRGQKRSRSWSREFSMWIRTALQTPISPPPCLRCRRLAGLSTICPRSRVSFPSFDSVPRAPGEGCAEALPRRSGGEPSGWRRDDLPGESVVRIRRAAFPGDQTSFSYRRGRTLGRLETILAIVERSKLGEIVGETSGGTNGALNSFALPGGYELTWTAERVRQYDGSPLFGNGIRPTIPVSRTRAGIAAGRDEVLERAVQAVK